MKTGIMRIGHVDSSLINRVQEDLAHAFPRTSCSLITETFSVPEEAFDDKRRQYRSGIVLSKIHNYAENQRLLDRILGIVDADIFVMPLNFVFGEAQCPGKAALVSIYRLRPEFYGKRASTELLAERSTKEAVHELGHTLGLGHCSNPFCVMYFSNSIFETDRKQGLFCGKCYLKTQAVADSLG
jgi:archaemetzincin